MGKGEKASSGIVVLCPVPPFLTAKNSQSKHDAFFYLF
jgi:hypothetical protein